MSEIKNQPVELNDESLDQVSGGVIRISANTNRIGFTTSMRSYDLKNCTAVEARNLCESLMGQFPNEAEYEAACEAALKAKGWI